MWRRIGVYITLLLVCCSGIIASAKPLIQQPKASLPSTTDALGFLYGRVSSIYYGYNDLVGDYIGFHAKFVLFLAIADPLICSLVKFFVNKNVQIGLDSPPSWYIDNNSIRIVFKTMVPGPI